MNNFSLALIVLKTMIGMFSAHIPLHSYFYPGKNVSVLFIPQMRPSFKPCHAGLLIFSSNNSVKQSLIKD